MSRKRISTIKCIRKSTCVFHTLFSGWIHLIKLDHVFFIIFIIESHQPLRHWILRLSINRIRIEILRSLFSINQSIGCTLSFLQQIRCSLIHRSSRLLLLILQGCKRIVASLMVFDEWVKISYILSLVILFVIFNLCLMDCFIHYNCILFFFSVLFRCLLWISKDLITISSTYVFDFVEIKVFILSFSYF